MRGPTVMPGYSGRDAATADVMRGGWFHTRDVARADDDGYLYIIDRRKDMIISGGYNVYPREVEEVLYEHPDVEEAAVIGVPDAVLGEEVAAVVVLRDGGDSSPTTSASTPASASRPTSTRGPWSSSMSCPRARPARSSSAPSSCRCSAPARIDEPLLARGALLVGPQRLRPERLGQGERLREAAGERRAQLARPRRRAIPLGPRRCRNHVSRKPPTAQPIP